MKSIKALKEGSVGYYFNILNIEWVLGDNSIFLYVNKMQKNYVDFSYKIPFKKDILTESDKLFIIEQFDDSLEHFLMHEDIYDVESEFKRIMDLLKERIEHFKKKEHERCLEMS